MRTEAAGGGSRGLTLLEVVVVLVVVLVAGLLLVMALPAWRENARLLQCQRHLAEIGGAVVLYDNATGHLPTVPAPGDSGASPLAAMLGQLGVASFAGLRAGASPPPAVAPGEPPGPSVITGFVCPADPLAAESSFPAPASYRATAGSRVDGGDGAFAPGRLVSLADVQRADGTRYTAGFAERLVGTGRPEPSRRNYGLVTGPIGESGCPDLPPDSWRGDAGSRWDTPGWASSLYNHATPPGGHPSCLAIDGATAHMGASSGHPGRVHVLILDGSVRPVTPRIDPGIWRALAAFEDSAKPEREAP